MFAEIRTERLVLRPVEISYLQSTHAYASDLENTHFMMFLPSASLEETAQTIAAGQAEWGKSEPARCEFVILKDDIHIGGITLYFLEDRSEGELGWILSKEYWGCGYVTEAARAMLSYAKEQWQVRRVIACCDSENMASRRVMEKLGMVHVITGKRRNRSMQEERIELIYEIML